VGCFEGARSPAPLENLGNVFTSGPQFTIATSPTEVEEIHLRRYGYLRVGFEIHACLAIRRTRSMTEAAYRKAFAESIEASKSFASLRFRLIHAKNLSTTHRR